MSTLETNYAAPPSPTAEQESELFDAEPPKVTLPYREKEPEEPQHPDDILYSSEDDMVEGLNMEGVEQQQQQPAPTPDQTTGIPGDVEMSEAEDSPLVELLVPVKRTELPTPMDEQIMESRPLDYPRTVHIGTGSSTPFSINTDAVFALRGSDVFNRYLPDSLIGGKRLRTIIVSDKASGPLGSHFELSLDDALQADNITPIAPAPKVKGKGKFEAPKVKGKGKFEAPEPPKEECVKAKFHLNTQTPHIEISAYDSRTSRWVSTRIWAQDFMWTAKAPWIGFEITQIPSGADAPAVPMDTKVEDLVEKMRTLDKTTVVQCNIHLNNVKDRVWDGLTASRLAEIRSKGIGKEASTLASLVHCLDKSDKFGMLFTSKSSTGNLTKWTQKLDGYFRDLLCLAKYWGNFWFYRLQCIQAGHNADDIELPDLPKVNWAVPRWLVTEWTTTRTTTSGHVTHSMPVPYKWQPLEFPDEFPDANETAFLLKMAVEQERDTQKRNLRALVQSDGTKWFQGKFFTLQHDGNEHTYSVEVYLGMPDMLADADVKIPAAGTRITLGIDRDNHAAPSKKNLVKMTGTVVWDESRKSTATFVCVLTSNKGPLECADDGTSYPVYIEYIVDNVPFDRQLRAIADGQRATGKLIGPDVRRIILNCHEPATGTDALKQITTPQQLVEFNRILAGDFAFLPNEVQKAAALDTTTSEIGVTTIIGPPGTGKTMMDVQILWAHGRIGRRIMGVAPTNSARDSLVTSFLRQNSSRPVAEQFADHHWVVFTGSQSSIAGAERLEHREVKARTDDELQLVLKNRDYWAHFHDAQSRDRSPDSVYSLGSKLLRRMNVWKAHATFDYLDGDQLYTWSNDWFVTNEKLPYLSEKDEKDEAKKHLEALEAHLAARFLKDVKYCFCTISTSAHALLLESGVWDLIVIDEAARETRAGMATILGAFTNRFRQLVVSGDHWQGEGIVIGKDSNIGYKLLSRNIFEQLADVQIKRTDNTTPVGVFMLNEGYRMAEQLMAWSNRFCYGGFLRASRLAKTWNQPLRHTLGAYWGQCLRTNFRGNYEQIALDCNFEAIVQPGGTTRVNVGEAKFIAWRIKDMLAFEPPTSSGGMQYARIVGTDFIVISNFTGQVSAIRQALREDSPGQKVDQKELDGVRTLLGTTSWVQGKEAPIAFYSLTVSTGSTRVASDDHIPIGFPAAVKNFNVSITRQRVARHIVGNFKLFVQTTIDKHPVVQKHVPFFSHVTDLRNGGMILSQEESESWSQERKCPDEAQGFDNKLRSKSTFDRDAMEMPENTVESGLHSIDSRPQTTGRTKPTAAPPNVKFSGLPDNKVTKPKKRGSKGAKHAAKRQGKEGGDNGGDNGGHGNESGQGSATWGM